MLLLPTTFACLFSAAEVPQLKAPKKNWKGVEPLSSHFPKGGENSTGKIESGAQIKESGVTAVGILRLRGSRIWILSTFTNP